MNKLNLELLKFFLIDRFKVLQESEHVLRASVIKFLTKFPLCGDKSLSFVQMQIVSVDSCR